MEANVDEQMLTQREAASYLKVCENTVRRYLTVGVHYGNRVMKLVPDEVVGKRRRYSVATLRKFKQLCREATVGEVPTVADVKQSEQDRYAKQAARALQDLLGR